MVTGYHVSGNINHKPMKTNKKCTYVHILKYYLLIMIEWCSMLTEEAICNAAQNKCQGPYKIEQQKRNDDIITKCFKL